MGAFVTVGSTPGGPAALAAQTPAIPGRLSVRPHEMTLGTRTERAGEQTLDSLPGVLVYVPKQCVGSRRCPLVVFLHGDDGSAKGEIEMQEQLADRYGMIFLAPQDITVASGSLDAALQRVLRTFAVAPDKIALAGVASGGIGAWFFGHQNLDVFSRVALLSATPPRPEITPLGWAPQPTAATYPSNVTEGPRNTTTQFFVAAGIAEAGDDVARALEMAQQARQEGHPVKLVLTLRPRAVRLQDREDVWRWLQRSWANPGTTGRSARSTTAPLLTTQVFTGMATFWTGLMAGEDSTFWTTALMTYRKEMVVPVGDTQFSVLDMVDVPALAAKYPMVTASLKLAGLTQQQEEAYRVALVSARASKVMGSRVSETSPLGRNIAFITQYKKVTNALLELMGVPRCETTGGFMSGCKQRGSLEVP